jgi:predicted nucleotidyltransferase
VVKETVLEIVHNYLQAVNQAGIGARRAVLFGSWARGEAHEESDIDLVVIAPEFDGEWDRDLLDQLWELTAFVPDAWRIEPIACGEREWLEDTERLILEYARREGEVIVFEPEIAS